MTLAGYCFTLLFRKVEKNEEKQRQGAEKLNARQELSQSTDFAHLRNDRFRTWLSQETKLHMLSTSRANELDAKVLVLRPSSGYLRRDLK